MRKTVHVRATSSVHKVGSGTYHVRTTVSNGSTTKTVNKTVHVHH